MNCPDDLPKMLKRYQVRSYEVDGRGLLRFAALVDYLQDAASAHSECLGVSIDDLRRRNVTWVMSRYLVKMMRHPAKGEMIDVLTWPSSREKLIAIREFEVIDQRERVLARAASSYVLLDLDTRRPVALGDHVPDLPVRAKRRLDLKRYRIPAVTRADNEVTFRVRYGDLDENGHVNHAEYIQWALETAPAEVIERGKPVEVAVEFRAEAFYGDRITASAEAIEHEGRRGYLHQLRKADTMEETTRLMTFWSPVSRA